VWRQQLQAPKGAEVDVVVLWEEVDSGGALHMVDDAVALSGWSC
jgi:hypothetical protein